MLYSVKDIQTAQLDMAVQVLEHEGDDPNQYELIRGLHAPFKDSTLIRQWKSGRLAPWPAEPEPFIPVTALDAFMVPSR